jgi:hypothetical protein
LRHYDETKIYAEAVYRQTRRRSRMAMILKPVYLVGNITVTVISLLIQLFPGLWLENIQASFS